MQNAGTTGSEQLTPRPGMGKGILLILGFGRLAGCCNPASLAFHVVPASEVPDGDGWISRLTS